MEAMYKSKFLSWCSRVRLGLQYCLVATEHTPGIYMYIISSGCKAGSHEMVDRF